MKNFDNIPGHSILPLPNKNMLIDLYMKKELSLMSIAEKFQNENNDVYSTLTPNTVKRWLKEYNIPTRSSYETLKGPKLPIPEKDTLKDLYINQSYSLKQIKHILMKKNPEIYTKLSISTVNKWFKDYNIPRRENAKSLKISIKKRTLSIPRKEKLEEWYLKNEYSLKKIASLLQMENKELYPKLSSKTVKKWLINYEIYLH